MSSNPSWSEDQDETPSGAEAEEGELAESPGDDDGNAAREAHIDRVEAQIYDQLHSAALGLCLAPNAMEMAIDSLFKLDRRALVLRSLRIAANELETSYEPGISD